MPRSLTSLSSLRPADALPKLETPSTVSPTPASDAPLSSSSVAEAAVGEAQLQATAQQFELLLHNTLQRTKEGVGKVREFVLKAAGGQHGRLAARRLIIMVLDLIETAQMQKRIDLFYLMDSLLQVLAVCSHLILKRVDLLLTSASRLISPPPSATCMTETLLAEQLILVHGLRGAVLSRQP